MITACKLLLCDQIFIHVLHLPFYYYTRLDGGFGAGRPLDRRIWGEYPKGETIEERGSKQP
jgi:hypothetical protein